MVAINNYKKEEKMSDTKYWDGYYEYWDRFVKEWFEQRKAGYTMPQDKISKAYKNAVAGLEFDELPTPYLGNPRDGVDAVIINLNPGLSEIIRFGEFLDENSDKTQYFSNRGKPLGWLIDEFENNAKGKYSKFIGIDSEINWSCLNPALLKYPRWVCGVDWWQGYDGKLIVKGLDGQRHANQRMPWIRRMYGRNICPSKVFSLELCPYHSKKFRIDNNGGCCWDELFPFIKNNVIIPALQAVVENVDVQFALAVGASVANFLDFCLEHGELDVVNVETWSFKDTKMPSGIEWPKSWKEKIGAYGPVERTYRLYSIKTKCGKEARVLVTWANGTFCAPKKEFTEVESVIREYVKNQHL